MYKIALIFSLTMPAISCKHNENSPTAERGADNTELTPRNKFVVRGYLYADLDKADPSGLSLGKSKGKVSSQSKKSGSRNNRNKINIPNSPQSNSPQASVSKFPKVAMLISDTVNIVRGKDGYRLSIRDQARGVLGPIRKHLDNTQYQPMTKNGYQLTELPNGLFVASFKDPALAEERLVFVPTPTMIKVLHLSSPVFRDGKAHLIAPLGEVDETGQFEVVDSDSILTQNAKEIYSSVGSLVDFLRGHTEKSIANTPYLAEVSVRVQKAFDQFIENSQKKLSELNPNDSGSIVSLSIDVDRALSELYVVIDLVSDEIESVAAEFRKGKADVALLEEIREIENSTSDSEKKSLREKFDAEIKPDDIAKYRTKVAEDIVEAKLSKLENENNVSSISDDQIISMINSESALLAESDIRQRLLTAKMQSYFASKVQQNTDTDSDATDAFKSSIQVGLEAGLDHLNKLEDTLLAMKKMLSDL